MGEEKIPEEKLAFQTHYAIEKNQRWDLRGSRTEEVPNVFKQEII